ncbi:MAG: hypothetical protein Fur0037_18450 [Planctomycetota bacterium]
MRALRAATASALCGFSGMCLELTAVRLLAPYFGDSVFVWTNVIGVILAALALGAWFGGRAVDRGRGASFLGSILLVAASLAAAAPFAGPPLGAFLLPPDLPLDAAMGAMVQGSLAATALLFGPPVFALGTVSPLLVSLLASGGVPLGRSVGLVSASATAGSLAGTFAATHWLVPAFGCRWTILLCALSIALAALLVRAGAWRALALLPLCAAPAFLRGPLKPAQPGTELLAERESRYQYLQVVRDGAKGRIELKVNEGLDSFQSLALERSRLTGDYSGGSAGGSYFDYHMLALLLAGDGERPERARALSIGDAAGTLRALYAAIHPSVPVDAVEIDPAAVELGKEFFRAEKAEGDLATGMDGRVYAAHAKRTWTVIHVDAYAHQTCIPAHLASVEFFELLRSRLARGGVVACNVGGLGPEDPVVRAVGGAMARVFGSAFTFHVPNSRNQLVLARAGASLDASCLSRFRPGRERLSSEDAAAFRRVVAEGCRPKAFVPLTPADGCAIPTDDRPFLDSLLADSYWRSRDPNSAVRCSGSLPLVEAEARAYAALVDRDAAGVLAIASQAETQSPYLRLLCGDARWSRRELLAARAEYLAGRSLAAGSEYEARIAQRLLDLDADLAPVLRARAIARRDGWLALSVLASGAALAVLSARATRRRRRMAEGSEDIQHA